MSGYPKMTIPIKKRINTEQFINRRDGSRIDWMISGREVTELGIRGPK